MPNDNFHRITIVIITKNEEHNISRCLESVCDFENRLVVDSGSTDRTVEIAEALGARVVHQDWLGYGKQKQKAVELAKTNWILSLDADERLSEDLLKNIERLPLSNERLGFAFNRKSFLLGKPIHFSGWNPDWVVRLVNRKYAQFTDDVVHEKLSGPIQIQKVRGRLLHYSYQSPADIARKTQLYGFLAQKTRVRLKNRQLATAWSFVRTYILRLGFLDGISGLQIALMNAKTTWIKYRREQLK